MTKFTENKKTQMRLLSGTALAIMIAGAPAVVSAQTAGSGESARVIEEVIVTSRKKEESLQDVSLAISAFSDEDIRARSLSQLEDVALQTPGLTFEDFSNGGYGTPVIRGTSQIRVDVLEQNVSVFYDGIYIPRQYSFDSGLANIERIEVVKGPQSALYGANSFSGAINYVSPERDLTELGGNVSGGIGIDDLYELKGHVNVPLVEDKLALSLAGSISQFGGEFKNNFPGASAAPAKGTDESVGGWDKKSVAAGLTFQHREVTAKLDYTLFDTFTEVGAGYTISNFPETGAPAGTPSGLNCGSASFLFGPRAFCGTLPSTPPVGQSGVGGVIVDPRTYFESETGILRGEFNFEFNDEFDLTYLYGNVQSDVFAAGSADSDPIAGTFLFFPRGSAIVFGPTGGVDYTTQELRLYYENESGLNVLLGGYHLDGEDDRLFAAEFYPVIGTPGSFNDGDQDLATGTRDPSRIDTETVAIFARVEAPITDTVSISAEARYSETDIDAVNFNPPLPFTSPTTESADFSAFTPRVNIEWQRTDDNLIYASIAQGVKAGGVNTSSVVLTPSETFYDEDSNTSFEIGTKNTLLDGRATLNAAAYLIEWEDLQVGVAPTNAGPFTGPIIDNLGAVESKGIEVDGTFSVTDSFTLNGGVSYTDASYDSGTISVRGAILCDNIVCDATGDISGNDLARVPEFQWNFGAQYDGQFGTDYDYYVRGDVAGQSEQFVEEFNLAKIESRALVNARAGISKGPVSADLYITNLLDEQYVSNSFYILNGFNQQYTATFGAGRRAGINVSYDF